MGADDTPTTELSAFEDEQGQSHDAHSADLPLVSGWKRILHGNRTLWWVALAAVLSLVAGLLIGAFALTPSHDADAPAPGLVTVLVQRGPLSNDVTLRADVGYADAVDVSVEGGGVVTGAVPDAGATLTPLSVALEVAGRPVIVLPGDLPSYRKLRVGVSGPDVLQIKAALASVGIDAGDPSSNVFDATTAAAVGKLYELVGYPAPESEEGAADAVKSAEQSLRSAESGVISAEHQLAAASAGPSSIDAWQADVAVAQAEQALADARDGADGAPSTQQAEWDLQTARLQRDQLWSPKDTGAEKSALDDARTQVEVAKKSLAEARQLLLPSLPAGEVLFLTELPRRVDETKVKRGDTISGAVMTVSGVTVRLTGTAAAVDAKLLQVGGSGVFELPDGTEHHAAIAELRPAKDANARWEVLLEPDVLTADQLAQLQGSNVRVRVGVGATDGDVLSVPLAALTAGPGGESRIEVVESDPRDGKDAKTRLVTVEAGLAAKGAVEITPVDGQVVEGERVVVGR